MYYFSPTQEESAAQVLDRFQRTESPHTWAAHIVFWCFLKRLFGSVDVCWPLAPQWYCSSDVGGVNAWEVSPVIPPQSCLTSRGKMPLKDLYLPEVNRVRREWKRLVSQELDAKKIEIKQRVNEEQYGTLSVESRATGVAGIALLKSGYVFAPYIPMTALEHTIPTSSLMSVFVRDGLLAFSGESIEQVFIMLCAASRSFLEDTTGCSECAVLRVNVTA